MKATKLALFFDCMRRSEICYDVTEVNGISFKDYFGAKGKGANDERNGTYLAVYVMNNSLNQDILLDSIEQYMGATDVNVYKSPYRDEDDELMYIIRITDED